jgi:dolichyl-phosphate beta-glucosyltransferase
LFLIVVIFVMNKDIYLSVVIPAFNEETRIGPTLENVFSYLSAQSYSFEVIVIDDCSTDATVSLVQKYFSNKSQGKIICNEKNLGKGASVKRGMLAAQGKFRLFSDADLSTPIEEVGRLVTFIPPFDAVIGSRRVKGARINKRQPLLREAAGRIFSLLVRLIALRGFIDTQCGFKLFTAESAKKIFSLQKIEDFGFDVEILYIATRLLGYKVKEAPVVWVDSPNSRVRVIKDSLKMFGDILKIRFIHVSGQYK